MLKKFYRPDDPPPGGPSPDPPDPATEPPPVAEEIENQTPPETPITSGVDGLNKRLDDLEAWKDSLIADREAEKAEHRKALEKRTKSHDQTETQTSTDPKPGPGLKRLRFLRGTRRAK